MNNTSDNDAPKLIDRFRNEFELHLPMRPLSKKTRKRVRDRARKVIEAAYEESTDELQRVDHWPAEQDSLAIDIEVFADDKNSPRVDNICKWFLDELGGPDNTPLVYQDDRQIKLLFAKKWKPKSGEFIADKGQLRTTSDEPLITVKARRLDYVKAELNQAAEANLDSPDDGHARTPKELIARIETLSESIEIVEADNWASDREHLRKLKEEFRYTHQLLNLQTVDSLMRQLFADSLFDHPRPFAHSLHSLARLPFVFNLGPLPSSGASPAFKQARATLLTEARNKFTHLFPLHLPVGLTVLYFETSDGKDLDNLVKMLLPDILDAFEPPSSPILFSPETPSDAPDIEFVEVVALPSEVEDIEPGTVLFALSEGARSTSWWEKVISEHFNDWRS